MRTLLSLPQAPHLLYAQSDPLRQQPIIGDHFQQAPGDAEAFLPLVLFSILPQTALLPFPHPPLPPLRQHRFHLAPVIPAPAILPRSPR